MSFKFIQEVMSPEELKGLLPISDYAAKVKTERDIQIRKIFTGESDKFLVIIGPCSADNEEAVLDYMSRLTKIAEKISDKILIIPRIYTNKPRTTGEGYKGILSQPYP